MIVTNNTDLDRLDEIANGYRAAQVLFTACRLKVFDCIGDELVDSQAIGRRLNADWRGTKILLDALVGLGLLERTGDSYRNSELSNASLRSGSTHTKLSQMLHGARLYERWGQLYDSVLTGLPVKPEQIDSRLAENPENFARAMAESARSAARLTAQAIDFTSTRSILDIGGGPGIFAIEMARRAGSATVTILDGAATLSVAEENVREAGLSDRIRLLPGDAFESDFDGPYDLIFISNVLHIYSPQHNLDLIAKCARSLVAKGRLVLKDFFLDDEGGGGPAGPLWSLLFAANMLVGTDGGNSYRTREVVDWCRLASLEFVQRIPVTERSILLCFQPAASVEIP